MLLYKKLFNSYSGNITVTIIQSNCEANFSIVPSLTTGPLQSKNMASPFNNSVFKSSAKVKCMAWLVPFTRFYLMSALDRCILVLIVPLHILKMSTQNLDDDCH